MEMVVKLVSNTFRDGFPTSGLKVPAQKPHHAVFPR
jgi:hypothetical protein